MQHPGNTDALRHDIDTGRTGDKVDFVDPAAAPLGTDAEAGGTSPTARELSRETVAPAAPGRGMERDGAGVLAYVMAAGAAFIAILGIVALTA